MQKVEIVDNMTMLNIEELDFKINHYRNFDKKKIIKNGGYTVISFVRNGLPFSITARCSASDTYDKRKGLFQCFSKYCDKFLGRAVFNVSRDFSGTYVVYVGSPKTSETVSRGEF